MDIKIKDENGEEKEQRVQSITVSQASISAQPTDIAGLTQEVKNLKEEIVGLKSQVVPVEVAEATPPITQVATETTSPVQTTVAQRSTSSDSESRSSFISILFGVIGNLIVFTTRVLFLILNGIFSFIKNILDMFLDILIAVDFTGILADLTDRKDRVE